MKIRKSLTIFLTIMLIIGTLSVVYAMPVIDGMADDGAEAIHKVDNRKDPLTEKQLVLKAKALEAKLNGKNTGEVVRVAKGQYVELEREGENGIWTVLGEFGNYTHNSIPEPDREYDNTTIWTADFSRDYYLDMLFAEGEGVNSMRNYYIEQSSNRFTVNGNVTEWVQVPGDYATYDDDLGGPAVWQFLIDSVDGWYDAQIAAGMSPGDINDYLSQFDVWDRYDWDGDGNFDEPDGYIDTFQSVHAGEGNEAGGGIMGDDAIWSHSWFAYSNLVGIEGPNPDFLIGGIQIGESDFWVNKYTIQPENGGVGVFAHEFAHDMGLPDMYDYTGENGTGFWTLMSSGSWLSDGTEDIGSKPCHLNAWEKFQLGWLNYEVAYAGETSAHRLGPAEYNTKQAQGVFVLLPDKAVTEIIGDPYSGNYFYYSGSGNDLDNYMTKSFTIAHSGAALTAMVNYTIETDWDYAYLVVSTDGGASWDPILTDHSTSTDPNGQNYGNGITGASGGWVSLSADLSAYADQTVLLGFRYWTDVAAIEPGFMVDDIAVTDYPLDDAESDFGWDFDGFSKSTGSESGLYFNAYLCEFRTYLGYDETLKVGPYNFGYPGLYTNYVDRFSYQDGLLIHYWDSSQTDNNVGSHEGHGLLLPIDAHYETLYRVPGEPWRNRIQTYDATFTKTSTDGIPMLHFNGNEYSIPELPGVSVFDDNTTYYDPANPLNSVIHPNTGTTIKVLQQPNMKVNNKQPKFMEILVTPSK